MARTLNAHERLQAERQKELADLQRQLQQAQEEQDRHERINKGLRIANKWLADQGEGYFRVGLSMIQGLEAERDKAIERGIGVYEYGLYLISLTRLAEASRWLIGTRLRAERERAEAAEGLLEDLVKALTQVRDEMVTCTEWREDDPLYRIADDTLAHVEALAQRKHEQESS